jgi:chromosome segregation ATPase
MQQFRQYIMRFSVVLLLCMTACVSVKKYEVVIKEKDRLDKALDESNAEINNLREMRLGLEEQLRNRIADNSKMKQSVDDLQKKLNDVTVRFSQYDARYKILNAALDSARQSHLKEMSVMNNQMADMQMMVTELTKRVKQQTTYSRKKK